MDLGDDPAEGPLHLPLLEGDTGIALDPEVLVSDAHDLGYRVCSRVLPHSEVADVKRQSERWRLWVVDEVAARSSALRGVSDPTLLHARARQPLDSSARLVSAR